MTEIKFKRSTTHNRYKVELVVNNDEISSFISRDKAWVAIEEFLPHESNSKDGDSPYHMVFEVIVSSYREKYPLIAFDSKDHSNEQKLYSLIKNAISFRSPGSLNALNTSGPVDLHPADFSFTSGFRTKKSFFFWNLDELQKGKQSKSRARSRLFNTIVGDSFDIHVADHKQDARESSHLVYKTFLLILETAMCLNKNIIKSLKIESLEEVHVEKVLVPTSKKLLKKEVERRYVIPKSDDIESRIRRSSKTCILDTYLPYFTLASNPYNMYQDFRMPEEYRKKISLIHRGFAQKLGIKAVPIKDIVHSLGYTNEQISDILTKVKDKRLELTLLGLGGIGSNLYQWITELCTTYEVDNLFRKVYMFEGDNISLTNLYRMAIPFTSEDIRTYTSYAKKQLKSDLKMLSDQTDILNVGDDLPEFHFKRAEAYESIYFNDSCSLNKLAFIAPSPRICSPYQLGLSEFRGDVICYPYLGDLPDRFHPISNDINKCGSYMNKEHAYKILKNPYSVIIGSPSISFRKELQSVLEGIEEEYVARNKALYELGEKLERESFTTETIPDYGRFYLATHKDNDINLILNPDFSNIDANMVAETYGKIEISVFLLNTVKLAITFLEDLASRDQQNNRAKDESLLDFNVCNISKKRNFKFNILRPLQETTL